MKRMFVSNLSSETSEQDVVSLFSQYGTVRGVRLARDVFSGRCRGFCLIDMEGHEARAAMAALDGKDFNGRNLRVKEEDAAARKRGRHGRR